MEPTKLLPVLLLVVLELEELLVVLPELVPPVLDDEPDEVFVDPPVVFELPDDVSDEPVLLLVESEELLLSGVFRAK